LPVSGSTTTIALPEYYGSEGRRRGAVVVTSPMVNGEAIEKNRDTLLAWIIITTTTWKRTGEFRQHKRGVIVSAIIS
jgi:hypothetical protein